MSVPDFLTGLCLQQYPRPLHFTIGNDLDTKTVYQQYEKAQSLEWGPEEGSAS